MGWIRGLHTRGLAASTPQNEVVLDVRKGGFEHIENVDCHLDQKHTTQSRHDISPPGNKYPTQPEHVSDESLPFIPPEEVTSKRRPGVIASATGPNDERKDYWIVVDNVVYDCTSFISEHPGGEQVILSFLGEDCSWQFWRFHGQTEMAQYGRALRIGRTKGVTNRFKEPIRFVGLSKFGNDEW